MSKRDLVKKLDSLAKRVKVRRAGILPLIDATKLFTADDWQAFREGDAETRERMRQDYAEREAALVAEQTADLPESDDPYRISAIIVRTYVPDEANAWRYFDDDDEPDTEQHRAALARREQVIRENRELAEIEAQAVLPAVETDPRDPNPDGDPSEILYIHERTGYPISRAEHQRVRQAIRERR